MATATAAATATATATATAIATATASYIRQLRDVTLRRKPVTCTG